LARRSCPSGMTYIDIPTKSGLMDVGLIKAISA
jgi:hypothetical protein